MKTAAKALSKTASQALQKILQTATQLSKEKWDCLCAGYLYQLADPSYPLSVAPSFDQSISKTWQKKDLGGALFSILKKNKQGDLICRYDVSVKYQACFKSKIFESMCDAFNNRGCTLSQTKKGCACGLDIKEKYAREKLQCHPNKQSCNGGIMSKNIQNKLVFGQGTATCESSFLVVDAFVRGLMGMWISTNAANDIMPGCAKGTA